MKLKPADHWRTILTFPTYGSSSKSMDHWRTNYFKGFFSSCLKPADHQRTIKEIIQTGTSRPLGDHPHISILWQFIKIGGPLADQLSKGGCCSCLPADHQRTIREIIQNETSGPLEDHPHIFYLWKFKTISGPLADQLFQRSFPSCLKPADHQRTIREIIQTETSEPLVDHFHISHL